MDELLTELLNEASLHSWPSSLSNTNASTTAKGTKIKPDADKDPNFKCVKDVFGFLCFMGYEDIQMWHNVNQHKQQLNPLLLMDLEASLCNKIESCGEETINPYHYQLLFSVVKEVVYEIYEGSPIHFPKHYFNRCLYSMHREHYLLHEVWTRVNSYLSLRISEQDHSIDAVVGQDLAKRSGWVKFQQEEEHAVLELEGMIVDDLLNEVIFL